MTRGAHVSQSGNLSGFEIALVSSSLVALVAPDATLDFLLDDAREFSTQQLVAWSNPRPDSDAPHLVLAHLMHPHPPFVLDQDADYLRNCYPECSVWMTTAGEMGLSTDEYGHRMETQVEVLNEMVANAAEHIASSDPEAVILIMSDHGSRYSLDLTDEHFRVFFAARTPEHEDLFPNDVSLVNVFRRLLSSYFDEDVPNLLHQQWLSDWDIPLMLTQHD